MNLRLLIILVQICFLILSHNSYGQWNKGSQVFKCAQFFGDSIIFLNDFEVNRPKRKLKEDTDGKIWDIYLMKGNLYRFVLCCKDTSLVEMKLYDDIITHNYPYGTTLVNGKDVKYFDCICERSDVYKLSILFKEYNLLGVPLNAIGILGFVKKVKINKKED